MTPRIQVLLSTYNGEKYIEEQIKSILEQKNVQVSLLIRDDGSTDNTVLLVNKFQDKRIKLIKGKNVGSTKSFLNLLNHAGDADYYSFADQDDVWDLDKLIIGINAIKDYSVPAIYSSNTRLVDENLNELKQINRYAKTDLGSAIIKNYVAGCTAVFNDLLLQMLKKYEPDNIAYHDWWVNLVALSLGGVSIYDREPHMSYRQHGNNVVGASDTFFDRWKHRLIKFKSGAYKRNEMAKQLLNAYYSFIPKTEKEILEKISNCGNMKYDVIIDKRVKTGNFIDDILFDLLVLLDKI